MQKPCVAVLAGLAWLPVAVVGQTVAFYLGGYIGFVLALAASIIILLLITDLIQSHGSSQ